MKKIYVGGRNAGRVYDVSSPDTAISRAASKAIQTDFDKTAQEIGALITRRIEKKTKYRNK
jgi:hypothetical protein